MASREDGSELFEIAFCRLKPAAVAPVRRRLEQAGKPASSGSSGTRCRTWLGLPTSSPGLLIHLFAWSDYAERDALLPGWWRDNWERPLGITRAAAVDRLEYWVIQPTASWRELKGEPISAGSWPIAEVRISTFLNGSGNWAARDFTSRMADAISRNGGAALAQFEVVIGPARPTLLTLVGWPDLKTLHSGRHDIDAGPESLAERKGQIDRFGRTLEEESRQFLVAQIGCEADSTSSEN